jgi:hypothetical protein
MRIDKFPEPAHETGASERAWALENVPWRRRTVTLAGNVQIGGALVLPQVSRIEWLSFTDSPKNSVPTTADISGHGENVKTNLGRIFV